MKFRIYIASSFDPLRSSASAKNSPVPLTAHGMFAVEAFASTDTNLRCIVERIDASAYRCKVVLRPRYQRLCSVKQNFPSHDAATTSRLIVSVVVGGQAYSLVGHYLMRHLHCLPWILIVWKRTPVRLSPLLYYVAKGVHAASSAALATEDAVSRSAIGQGSRSLRALVRHPEMFLRRQFPVPLYTVPLYSSSFCRFA